MSLKETSGTNTSGLWKWSALSSSTTELVNVPLIVCLLPSRHIFRFFLWASVNYWTIKVWSYLVCLCSGAQCAASSWSCIFLAFQAQVTICRVILGYLYRVAFGVKRLKGNPTVFQPLSEESCLLRSVRYIMVNELAPDCRYWHQMWVRNVWVRVSCQRNLSRTRKKLVVWVLPGNADSISIIWWKIPQIPPVGDTPVGILYIIAVPVVCPVLVRLTGDIKFYGTNVTKNCPTNIRCR